MPTLTEDIAETSLERFLLREREEMKAHMWRLERDAHEARSDTKAAVGREESRVAEQIALREGLRKERDALRGELADIRDVYEAWRAALKDAEDTLRSIASSPLKCGEVSTAHNCLLRIQPVVYAAERKRTP